MMNGAWRKQLATVSAAVSATVSAALLLAAAPAAAQDFGEVRIETIEITKSVYMLTGAGGNIGVSVGEDGVFMIDDQFAPLTERILEAVKKLTDEPVRFLVNTHWHFDHTGGNENLGSAGTVIVAHDKVRERMSTDQFMEAFNRAVPASPAAALPAVTFTDAVTFHWNGDAVHVFHVDPAHTDGDSIIHFRKANVIHMGDTYFNGLYPFIDVGSGGSIDGMIAAVDRVLPLCDDETKIVPGHGPLSGAKELRSYARMLRTVRDRVRDLVAQGKSRDEVIAAGPTSAFDEDWGGGFLQPDAWVGIVYDGMTQKND